MTSLEIYLDGRLQRSIDITGKTAEEIAVIEGQALRNMPIGATAKRVEVLGAP